ncbi:MAG: transposase [Thermoplasmata archaeon]|nr:MAG: transposase [Thermoplasmata archaeon]
MSTVIISSTQDSASTNIKKALLMKSGWEEQGLFLNQTYYKNTSFSDIYMVTINDKTIIHEGIENQIQKYLRIRPTEAIFISRHRSKTGAPSLTTHPIGNFGPALFGGKNNTVSPPMPHHMTALLRLINDNAKKAGLYHKVCFEVTHHGPYMSIPTLFAEVGSNEEEWEKQKPADIIAQSLICLFESNTKIKESAKDIPVLIGIGGGHYAPRFTDVALGKNVAFAHMIPSYHINDNNINFELLKNVIETSSPIHGVYLHRKALKKSQQTQFKTWCKELEIPVVSSKYFTDVS